MAEVGEAVEGRSLADLRVAGQTSGEIHPDTHRCRLNFLSPEGADVSVAFVPIVHVEGKLLVAVPFVAWHRTASRRLLPKGALSKPVPVEVSGTLVEEAAEEESIDITTKAWVGFLSAELLQAAVIGEPEEGAITAEFGEELEVRVQLSALVLVAIADEHFSFVSAQSGGSCVSGCLSVFAFSCRRAIRGETGKARDGFSRGQRLSGRLVRGGLICSEAEEQRRRCWSSSEEARTKPLSGTRPGSRGCREAVGFARRSASKTSCFGSQARPHGRCASEEAAPAGRPFRERGGRGRFGGRRRGGHSRRAPYRASHFAAHQSREDFSKEQARQGWARRHFRQSRRRSCRRCTLQQQQSGKLEVKGSSIQKVEERFEGESGLAVGKCGKPDGRGLHNSEVGAWFGTAPGDITVVAGAPQSPSQLSYVDQSCLADCRHPRLLAKESSGRSQSTSSPGSSSLRPSCPGWRKLAACPRTCSRASTSLLVLPGEASTGAQRASVVSFGRREVFGVSPLAPERPGLLLRKQKEAEPGLQDWEAGRRGRSGGRRLREGCSERKERAEGEGKGEKQSQPGPGCRARGARRLKKRAEERAEVDLQKEEHLPGSRASTVHANIFDECFTVLLKSRTSFSVFLRSMFASCAAARAAPLGQVWPMPLPYPEVHTSRRSRLKECGPLKVCTNYVVAVLSWLHLGEKRKPTEELGLGLGTKLNRDQWKAVHRMQPLFSTWLDGGTVTPEDMGRTAAKVESIEAVLARLEEVAEEVKEGLGGYKGCRRSHKPAFSFEEEHEAEVLGRVGSNLEHVAKDIEPHRLKFVGEPSFDPTPFLDYANREQYNRPLDLSFEESLEDLDLPRVKVRCKRGQGVQLLEKLDSVKRLALVPLKEVREHLLNGMFCLPKDQHRDRMILDARRPNAVEASERRWVYSLGSTCQLNHIHLKEDEILLIHAEDLREFYHCFLVSEQRCRRNGLQMKVKPEEVQHLQCFEAWMAAEDHLVPCLATMAMGDTNAVAFGQCAHLSVILRTNVFELEDFLTLKQRPNRKSIKCGLMIDDFVVLEVHKGQEAPCKEDAETEGRKRMLKVREAYVEAGLPRHEGKAVEQEEKGEFWGYEVDGKRGLARPSLKRLIPLCFILCRVVALGKISVGLLEVIAGALVAAFQCRRRLMSALQEVYRAQRGRSRAEVVRMSMKLKEELLVCLGLLPLAVVDMRLRPSAKLVCSDASTECEAAVQAEVGEARRTEFQRHGLQKGFGIG